MELPGPLTDMLANVAKAWKNHGTKAIGFVQGTVAAVAGTTGIIPEHHLKYYMLVSGLLTFWRGFLNDTFKDQGNGQT